MEIRHYLKGLVVMGFISLSASPVEAINCGNMFTNLFHLRNSSTLREYRKADIQKQVRWEMCACLRNDCITREMYYCGLTQDGDALTSCIRSTIDEVDNSENLGRLATHCAITTARFAPSWLIQRRGTTPDKCRKEGGAWGVPPNPPALTYR